MARSRYGKSNNKRAIRIPMVIGALALLLLLAFIGWRDRSAAPSATQHPIPSPDTASMPAPIATALEEKRAAVEADRSSAQAWGRYGMQLDSLRLYAEAAECYRVAHELNPSDFYWAYLLAVTLDFSGGDPAEVNQAYDRARAISPLFPPAPYRHGEALVRQGDLEAARAAYGKAVELDPNFAMAQRGLGQALLSLGETEAALAPLERAAALEPNDAVVYGSLARAYGLVGRQDEADSAADLASRLQPQHSVPDPIRFEVEGLAQGGSDLVRRYQNNMRTGRFEEAAQQLIELLADAPDSATYEFDLAMCYKGLGQPATARDHFTRATELQPDLIVAYQQLAELAENEGRFDESVFQHRRALAQQPNNFELRKALALRLGMSGDLAGAVLEFEYLDAMTTVDAEVHHNWGTALMRLGQFAPAAERFQEANQLNPGYAPTHYNLGLVLEQLGRVSEAITAYREAASLDPTSDAANRLAALGG